MNGFRLFFDHLKAVGVYEILRDQLVQQSAHNAYFQKRFFMSKTIRSSRAQDEVELDVQNSEAEVSSQRHQLFSALLFISTCVTLTLMITHHLGTSVSSLCLACFTGCY